MDAAVAVIGTLAGSLIGSGFAFLSTWHSARAAAERDQREHQRELARVRREAFGQYLTASFALFNAVTLLSQRLAAREQPIEIQDINALPEYHRWAEAGTPLYFLLDDHGTEVLNAFEEGLFANAKEAGRGVAEPGWFAQIKPLLKEMNRMA